MKYLLAALLVSSGVLTPKLAQADSDGEGMRWDQISKKINKFKKHIENSIWILSPPNLLAYENEDGISSQSIDQTVWLIDKFENGYFFGDAYVSINQKKLSHLHLIGSVTSLGDVYITFYPMNGEVKQADVVTRIGKFEKVNGRYVFIMQMNSTKNKAAELSHLSYMINVQKGDDFYKNLPGENMSVREFLSQFASD